MTKDPYEIDSWTDPLGQQYGPGDCVAYVTINGRSPQMVVGTIVSIHTHDKDGKRYVSWNGKEEGVSVKIRPLLDCRDFYRSYNARPVHVKIWQNILKLPIELTPKTKVEREREENLAGLTAIIKDLNG